MATQRRALGRGLGALLPGSQTREDSRDPVREPTREETVPAAAPAAAEVESPRHEIRVDDIDPNPDQPRQRFDADDLERLADSIRRHGLLQPVVVRRNGSRYELLVGERRWRAARAAGLPRIPVVTLDVDPRERLELALIENVQRRDLNPIELATAFRTLADTGVTQDEIGRRMGLDRSSVANHLRLLELPRELREDVENGSISMGHAKTLLALANPERRRQLRDRIVSDGLSVRAAEDAARELGAATRSKRRRPAVDAPADPDTEHLLGQLRDRLQTKVRIVPGRAGRGRIEIEYYGPDDLDRLASQLLEG